MHPPMYSKFHRGGGGEPAGRHIDLKCIPTHIFDTNWKEYKKYLQSTISTTFWLKLTSFVLILSGPQVIDPILLGEGFNLRALRVTYPTSPEYKHYSVTRHSSILCSHFIENNRKFPSTMLKQQLSSKFSKQLVRYFSSSRPSAADVARMTLVGRIGHDLEKQTSANGHPYLAYSLASSNFKGETSWFRVVVFDPKTVDFMTTYLKKGDRVYVEADAAMHSYENEAGERRSSLQLVQSLVNSLGGSKRPEEAEHAEQGHAN